MKLTERVYLVGSGWLGFGISNELDCHVYLLDGGEELALVDAGAGATIEPIVENMRRDGLSPEQIKYVLLTHAHADHAGAAIQWHDRFGCQVLASQEASNYVQSGDEERISLRAARQAGVYPKDYVFHACPVEGILREGDTVKIGELSLAVLETPGHCSGLLSFLVKVDAHSLLFSGDSVFHDGKVLVTNLWDCNLQDYARSIEKLAQQLATALLPGHLSIAMSQGDRHVQKARDILQTLSFPPNVA
jgi:hydroxyacylglutathione hydrolase